MTADFASPTDIERFGEYVRPESKPGREPFCGVLGTPEFPFEQGRYHLYAGWFCPWAHRVVLSIELNGLQDFVSVSYVDNTRDARGWAFREATGPDPLLGVALLKDVYERDQPGYDGHVSVPLLWDKRAERIVTNDVASLAASFPAAADGVIDPHSSTAPPPLRTEINQVERWLRLHDTGPDDWNTRLGDARCLVGKHLTEADIYLWVKLVRADLNEDAFPSLLAYRDRLWSLPAFARTTDTTTF